MFCRGSTPWPRKVSWLPVCVPPTLIALVVTPGACDTIAQASRALGTVFMISVVNVKPTAVDPESMTGDSPVTVTDSATLATPSLPSTV